MTTVTMVEVPLVLPSPRPWSPDIHEEWVGTGDLPTRGVPTPVPLGSSSPLRDPLRSTSLRPESLRYGEEVSPGTLVRSPDVPYGRGRTPGPPVRRVTESGAVPLARPRPVRRVEGRRVGSGEGVPLTSNDPVLPTSLSLPVPYSCSLHPRFGRRPTGLLGNILFQFLAETPESKE